jgi:hypothetical protein
MVFSTVCDSASITTIMSKWLPIAETKKVGWVEDDSHSAFG